MSEVPDISLYVWIGEDAHGDIGVCSVMTPFGPSNAVFGKYSLAEKFTDQIQARANLLGKPVHLMEFRATGAPDPIDTVTPTQNPQES